MADNDDKADQEPTLLERWLADQKEWQRTAMAYLDSMVKNDDFLVHLGNAMRGSLLAGKPYPTAAAAAPAAETPTDDRLEQVLHELHEIRGQLADLSLSLDELRASQAAGAAAAPVTRSAAQSRAKSRPRGRARPKDSKPRSKTPTRRDRD